jgi:DNA-binding response OmpR family regulator
VSANPELLLIEEEQLTAAVAPALRASFTVAVTATVGTAREYVWRAKPAVVVAGLDVLNGDSLDILRDAKLLEPPAAVLVTTADVERVPEALAAGCDSVLLKPFAPNLLHARIGRLLRDRSKAILARNHREHSDALLQRAHDVMAKAQHLVVRTESPFAGTNRVWPNDSCPYCAHEGVTSFEYASRLRSWYACLNCRKVWLAKRQD